MEYFQLRKNSRQVLRIYRGPYQGFDITRIQLWFKGPEDSEYKPGRVIAFASELISGVVEGLMRMSSRPPLVEVGVSAMGDLPRGPAQLVSILQGILKAHKRPLHWENIWTILQEEEPSLRISRWTVYNALLGNPIVFRQVDEDVFSAQ